MSRLANAVKTPAIAASKPRRRSDNTLRTRVFAWFGMVCLVVSVAVMASQVTVFQQRAQIEIDAAFERVTLGTVRNLEHAFVKQAEGQVELILDALHAEQDVTYVQLILYEGRELLRGTPDPISEHRTYPIRRIEGLQSWERIGTLTVGATTDRAQTALQNALPRMAIASVLTGLAAAVLAAAITDRLVLRHVQSLAQQLTSPSESAPQPPVVLDRKNGGASDDLDKIVLGINTLRRQAEANSWAAEATEADKDAPGASESRKPS